MQCNALKNSLQFPPSWYLDNQDRLILGLGTGARASLFLTDRIKEDMPIKLPTEARQFGLAPADKLASFDALDAVTNVLRDNYGVRITTTKVYSRNTANVIDDVISRRDAVQLFMGVTSIPMEITVSGQSLSQAYFTDVNAGELVLQFNAMSSVGAEGKPDAEYEFFEWLFGPSLDYGRFLLNIMTWKASK